MYDVRKTEDITTKAFNSGGEGGEAYNLPYWILAFISFVGNSDNGDALEYFTESLSKFTRFSGFRPLATLSYASEVHNGSSIVSRYTRSKVFYSCVPKAQDTLAWV